MLSTGGQVFFAMDRDEVVGTCAAIRFPPSTVELAKLAVSPDAQGRGIGRRHAITCFSSRARWVPPRLS